MDTRPYTPQDADAWDRLALSSPDAWFWQSRRWLQYSREYARDSFVEELSFFVTEGGALLGIVPLFHLRVQGQDRFGFFGDAMPAPAAASELSAAKRREVLAFAVDKIRALAAARKISSFQLKVPSLAPAAIESCPPSASPFLRLGALDLPFQTQVIDLRRDAAALWTDVRHGHHAAIRKAEKTLSARVWHGPALEDAAFARYQALHAKDAGRVTRSQATFDMMRDWARDGHAALVEVTLDGKPVSFALILLFARGAFYGSACKDPDLASLPSAHLSQWTSILWLKDRGFHFYDLGLQQFGLQWFDQPSPKDVSISLFKRGFGGATAPVFVGEFHDSPAGLRAAVQARLEKFESAASLQSAAK